MIGTDPETFPTSLYVDGLARYRHESLEWLRLRLQQRWIKTFKYFRIIHLRWNGPKVNLTHGTESRNYCPHRQLGTSFLRDHSAIGSFQTHHQSSLSIYFSFLFHIQRDGVRRCGGVSGEPGMGKILAPEYALETGPPNLFSSAKEKNKRKILALHVTLLATLQADLCDGLETQGTGKFSGNKTSTLGRNDHHEVFRKNLTFFKASRCALYLRRF
ncbi:hypothetical protein M408DRAFT_214198 [Serendipita vermifera MAFF 305830]|uniref:Uncharacterized protein n=1 Tax=Serendipita vermifera MAFF 305830 TaxID=933852 RepID=A0A0C3B5N4_SERVB|nr:hypothetical protein M408DRAFT_214198 [Serendipita vermifera MAFF 305830]